ncbi:hypothetical protein GOQ27_13650 [Clostridium sp. D2Q-11]|uniref:Uncharacterized protein n=1 Tax=Anaeromonas frigoriresistens TaxID=2683708 RepID=A0A942UXQ8_9FIRM|nr:hypothetical protein [Anaeromonas frigoriresistens]MBS4539515.1 hypothetical protein [Anaeromonas frigoriresistens]
MSYFIRVVFFIGIGIILLFILSLIGFYLYRKRQLDKIKIIKFINDNEKTFSTYNIHNNIFKNKKASYVISLLQELENENIIKRIEIGNSEENGLWEHIQG